MPKEDDVLPLSKPVIGVSGKVYKELPVPAGTTITISPIGYNMYVCPPLRNHEVVIGFQIRVVGTRTCGDQILMNSDRSDGST